MEEKIRRQEKILDTVGEWIRSADQKVSVFLAFEGVLLTILIPNYSKTITDRFTTHVVSLLNGALIISAAIAFLIAVIGTLIAIFPRTSNKVKSHLYFGSIKAMTVTKYKRDMEAMTKENYFEELCEQVHTNAGIAIKKYFYFQTAILTFIIGLIFLIGSYTHILARSATLAEVAPLYTV